MTLPHSPFIKTLSGVFTAYHDVGGCSPLIMRGERLTAWCANETHNTSALTCKAALGSATLHLQAQPSSFANTRARRRHHEHMASLPREFGFATTKTCVRKGHPKCVRSPRRFSKRVRSSRRLSKHVHNTRAFQTCSQPSRALKTSSHLSRATCD